MTCGRSHERPNRPCVRRRILSARPPALPPRSVQMDWIKNASYSRFHPDNLNKLPHALPDPVKGPPPVVSLSQVDRTLRGAWGHRMCCERPYGPCETTTRIKDNVVSVCHPCFAHAPPSVRALLTCMVCSLCCWNAQTAKVGGSWLRTEQFEKGNSVSNSAMYGGSYIEPSFEQLVELRGKKG